MLNFLFDKEENLKPQRIRKSELAAIYGVSLRTLRYELENRVYVEPRKWFYTIQECEKIFALLGTPDRTQVEAVFKR